MSLNSELLSCILEDVDVMWTPQYGTENAKTHNRTTQKTEKMSNTDTTKKLGVNL
jgi:hypothetical protein